MYEFSVQSLVFNYRNENVDARLSVHRLKVATVMPRKRNKPRRVAASVGGWTNAENPFTASKHSQCDTTLCTIPVTHAKHPFTLNSLTRLFNMHTVHGFVWWNIKLRVPTH